MSMLLAILLLTPISMDNSVTLLPPVVVLKAQQAKTITKGQRVAQARADYMARHNYKGHPPRRRTTPPDFTTVGSFEGVGWTQRRNATRQTVRTCRPSGRSGAQDDNSRKLIGDAVAHGNAGSYRVRIWGKR